MRTNIEIDDQLLKEAIQVSGVRTTKDLVHEALRTLIIVKKQKDLTDLAGKIDFHNDFDHKDSRKLRAVSEDP
ncbi:type II toxin-antitoxin system VapB family antitoxin [Desulfatitalea alkaliphila]|uniref:Type II toxin-antitoxin system VapB family antitoxin n=1 Tax=Desulfatitalea alkaliphila TaxID=2929485 RepID=A0AA41R5Z6_9BACT|nr:type II toxin-antitoxin system VapB family antitoxin [Desulfatitalea alkaliphila]MCJ8502113.1 type II toxin-antitoxin system VapB family antitoxin [Desulfatitalea alkaliphila]